MKKIAIGICIVIMLLLPSVSAFTHKAIVIQETNDCDLDIIYDDMKEKLENVETQNERNIVFKETILELDNNGFLQDISVKEAYDLIDNANGDLYSVHGQTDRIYFLENIGVHYYKESWNHEGFMRTIYDFIWRIFLLYINFRNHDGSWITFGYGVGPWNGDIETYHPAHGYVNIVHPDGTEEEYNGEIYGRIGSIWPVLGSAEGQRHYMIGIKGFKGVKTGNYFIGTAEQVKIRYEPE